MSRILFILVFFGLVGELFSLLPPRTMLSVPSKRGFRRGAIHVHSMHNSADELLSSAKAAGLDFLTVTDLGNTRLQRSKGEKSKDGVDLYVDLEAKTPAGHALIFFSHTASRELKDEALSQLAWKHFLSQENPTGVFVAIAHPSSPSEPWNRLDRFSEGIEVFNLRTMVERGLREGPLHQLVSLAIAPFNPFLAVSRSVAPYEKDLLAWDAMNAMSQGHFAYAAQDAPFDLAVGNRFHAIIPSQTTLLKLVRNIVFISPKDDVSYESRRAMTYDAVQRGQSAMAFEYLYPYDGSEWVLKCAGKSYRSGDEVKAIPYQGCDFSISLPEGLPYEAKLVLYRDGEVFRQLEGVGSLSRIPIDGHGVYRLEVWVRLKTLTGLLLNDYLPYTFYNPIYVR